MTDNELDYDHDTSGGGGGVPYISTNREMWEASPRSPLLPPQSIHAEHSLLGGLLLDQEAWSKIADLVAAHDFYNPSHQVIFRAAMALAEAGQPIDTITLGERLKDIGKLEAAGGQDYLAQLASETPSAVNIVDYANIVRRNAMLRLMISTGTAIADSAYHTNGREVSELLDEAERKVLAIAEHESPQGKFQKLDDLVTSVVEKLEVLSQYQSAVTGLATGFLDFDKLTAGLHAGDLVVIAGRPAMGKTAYALGIAANVAVKLRKPVAVFSMEMAADLLAMRLLSSYGRLDQQRLRTGQLQDEEWVSVSEAIRALSAAPLFIDDTPALTPTELRARARRLKREQGDLALVVIDYLQLMQATRSVDNRAAEISGISRALKALAKELRVPVVALSQLNRGLEQRTNKRPIMSDLRESGAIEQDADLIVFIYRDEVYNEDSPDKGVAEIIIGKQRNGPTGVVRLAFFGQFTRFENYSDGDGYHGESY